MYQTLVTYSRAVLSGDLKFRTAIGIISLCTNEYKYGMYCMPLYGVMYIPKSIYVCSWFTAYLARFVHTYRTPHRVISEQAGSRVSTQDQSTACAMALTRSA